MEQRVIVVTGGNRGLGLEICDQLAKQELIVVLTSRNQKDGLEAVENFSKRELTVRYHPLDVTNPTQILKLADFLTREFGRCDGLVNNAGIMLERGDGSFFSTDVAALRETMETNVNGPYMLCQALVPLMKKNNYGRIVNMSSGLGQLSEMGAGFTSYRISKTAINAMTRILAAELAGTNILVNSMCPGWCKTRMGGAEAPRSAKQGADTAFWLSTLPDGGPTGKLFRDRQEIPW